MVTEDSLEVVFAVDADGYLRVIEDALLAILSSLPTASSSDSPPEAGQTYPAIAFLQRPVSAAMRAAHTLKGNAAAIDATHTAELAHELEDLLQRVPQDRQEAARWAERVAHCIAKLRRSLTVPQGNALFRKPPPSDTLPAEAEGQAEGQATRSDESVSVSMWEAPFRHLLDNLSQHLNKPIAFTFAGAKDDLPRHLVRSLGPLLVHLLRNAADHGLESAEQRARAGKPTSGRVCVNVRVDGCYAIIEVTDDGQGVQIGAVAAAAVAKGLIDSDAAAGLSVSNACQLLFEPGFSTCEGITRVSGRGVGLDVVRSVVEGLRGEVEAITAVGRGTTFRVKVPLS